VYDWIKAFYLGAGTQAQDRGHRGHRGDQRSRGSRGGREGCDDRRARDDGGDGGDGGDGDHHHDNALPLPVAAAASGCTGALAWFAAFPSDVVKTMQQAATGAGKARPSAIAVARGLWAQGGIRAFYKGAYAGTTRAVLVTSSRIVVFEWMVWHNR